MLGSTPKAVVRLVLATTLCAALSGDWLLACIFWAVLGNMVRAPAHEARIVLALGQMTLALDVPWLAAEKACASSGVLPAFWTSASGW